MFLSKDKSKKINVDNLFDEYATILSRGGPAGKKGDKTVRKKEIIYGICEDCGSYFYMSYGVFLKRSLCICSKCVIKKTKLENHGDANFNNRKKAFETNMETYQTIGTPRKGINKGISKSVETRNKISQKAKERFKNKVNHPMYGKKHTEESKKKNKHSNLEYLKENGLQKSYRNSSHNSGSFYSEKMREIIYYRSSYEKWFYYMLEQNIEVLNYYIENICIPYLYKDEEYLYFPDVSIEFSNGKKFIIEIKPTYFLDKDINLEKWKYAKEWCSYRNLEFLVLTEKSMLTFIIKNSSANTLMHYPEEWSRFIFEQAQKVTNDFIEKGVI